MVKKAKTITEDSRATSALDQLFSRVATEEFWNKLDSYQLTYAEEIRKRACIFVDAKAGTGKTTIAVLTGLEMLRKGKVSKLHYVRFPDSRAQKLGYIPGDSNEKEFVYMLPFYDATLECGLQKEAVDTLVQKGLIELSTDITLRGRNLKETYLIIDEAQNAHDLGDLNLVLTRMHDDGGKVLVIGHSGQVDGKVMTYGSAKLTAFQVYMLHMTKKPWAVRVDLPVNYRGKLSLWADSVMETVKELEG